MTLTDKIIEACKVSAGLTRTELAVKVGTTPNKAMGVACYLLEQGRLHKSGTRRAYRFFTFKLDADAWALIAEDAYVAQLRANKEATRLARNEARRTGNPPGPAPKPKEAKVSPTVIRSTEAPKPTKVIWPEHVAVQVIPTPPSRFAFQPKEGWSGQITADWMNRRQQGAGA
jgi:hypothetical protein